MLHVKALINGEYDQFSLPYGYQVTRDLLEGIRFLNRDPEQLGYWDVLRIEDDNGRILAKKERWMSVKVWQDGRWMDYGSEAAE